MQTPDRTPSSKTAQPVGWRASFFSFRNAVIAFAVIEAIGIGWILLRTVSR